MSLQKLLIAYVFHLKGHPLLCVNNRNNQSLSDVCHSYCRLHTHLNRIQQKWRKRTQITLDVHSSTWCTKDISYFAHFLENVF